MTTSPPPVIVWFRQDLRLSDNPALMAAIASGAPVIPLYILDDQSADEWKMGGASRWWLHHSLNALDQSFSRLGGQLMLRQGTAKDVLLQLIETYGAQSVYWNRCYEPWARDRDAAIKSGLKDKGLSARSFNGSLIVEPWEIATKAGAPYRVFTPFWRALQAKHEPDAPLPAPESISFVEVSGSDALKDWALLPHSPDWSSRFTDIWAPGEHQAQARLSEFLSQRASDYHDRRNTPGVHGTSRLSPHLHFGEISPRQIWHGAVNAGQRHSECGQVFLSEIAWREFSYNLLYHFPDLPHANFQARFNGFEWENDPGTKTRLLKAWQTGQTGYPIVDAGMRELWATGWMHNRVRMIVASFLIKDLMIDWRDGEAWFWDTLVDADLASNAASWQWTAGSGADAAPYFRVFNPVSQGEKFDPDGDYVRTWLPELEKLSAKAIHAPWQADRQTLLNAGVLLGQTYPEPIVDHAEARKRALAAFEKIKDAA